MAAPWEKYRQTSGKPWEKYTKAAAAPEPSMFQKIGNAISGDAAERLPDVYGDEFAQQAEQLRTKGGRSDFRESAALSASAVFGDDSDVATTIRRQFPDAQIEQDANGNDVVRMPDGKRYYINQPGLDKNDAGRFAGKVLSFLPAGKLASLGSSLAAKVVIGSAAAMGTDAAMQVGAGRSAKDFDPVQTGFAGLFGGGAEIAAPILQRGGGWIADKLRTNAQKVARGQALARKAGLSEVPEDVALALYGRRSELAAGVKPEAALAEDKFGFRLTRGQKTGDEALLDYEDFIRNADPKGPLVRLDKLNTEQAGRNAASIRTTLARGEPAALEQDAARVAQESLRAAEEAKRAAIRQAYEAAGKAGKGVYAGADDVRAFPDKITQGFRGKVALSPELTPATLGAQQILTQFVEDSGGQNIKAFSLKALEELRKRMNVYRGAAAKPTDVRAMGELFKQFDNLRDQAITAQLMDGGPEALKALQQARGLNTQYFRQFDGDSEAGRALLKSLADDATPEQVAQYLIGANGVNSAGAAKIAARYLDVVGPESPGANALRDMVARRLLAPQGDDVLQSATMTAKQLNAAINGKGNSLMNVLFNKTDLRLLREYENVMRTFFMKPQEPFKQVVGRSAGTTERLVRWISMSRLGKLPVGNMMSAMIARGGSLNATGRVLPTRPSVLPAGMTTLAPSGPEDRRTKRRPSNGRF